MMDSLKIKKCKFEVSKPVVKRRKKNGLKGKREVEETRPWCDLPDDILILAMEKMRWKDRISFRAVCKRWLLPIHGIPRIDTLAWIMCYKWNITYNNRIFSTCKLAEPIETKYHTLEETAKGEERREFVGAKPCASRYGWVLFSREKQDDANVYTTSLFVFSPFTDEVIKLPYLDHCYDKIAFSSAPTSANCMFFAGLVEGTRTSLRISTCGCSDKSWKTFTFPIKRSFKILDVTYMDGFFYCVFDAGELGAFSLVSQEWSFLTNFEFTHGTRDFYYGKDLIASDGDLLLVCGKSAVGKYLLHVLKFDWSRMDWVVLESIGNRALFLGLSSFSIPAVGDASRYPDYIFSSCGTRWYSLKTDESDWVPEYKWFSRVNGLERIWIELPTTL